MSSLDTDTGQKQATVLVVDDTPDNLSLMSGLLKDLYKVKVANNGEKALQIAGSEAPPDLILLDISMPVMDGLTMLQKLREANEYGKNVPVIFLTNLSASNEDIVRKVAETEPAYYMVKTSTTPEEVVEKIKERLSRK